MGLAALTFASVAGASVSATSTNANAAKHAAKKVAKKVTYKTTDSKLDQSVVYVSTGKNAVYSKPGTVKGAKVVASKSTMASLANTKSVSAQFMAYQEATTSKGAKYLKVVSFDKKIRGYVYVGGVQKANGVTDTSATYNFNNPSAKTLYLKQPRLFDNPYGSQFGAKLVKLSSDAINSTYTASKAVVNANGDTYFYVTANDSKIGAGLTGNENAGWVNAKNLSTLSKDQFTDNKFTINFVDQDTKAVVDTQVATVAGGYDVYTNGSTVKNAFAGSDVSTQASNFVGNTTYSKLASYTVSGSDQTAANNFNYAAFNTPVTKGSVVTVYVKKDKTTAGPVQVQFKTADADGSNQKDLSNPKLSDNKTTVSNYAVNLTNAGLSGYEKDVFSFSNVINNLFATGKAFNTVYDAQGNAYQYNDTMTKANNSTYFNLYKNADTSVFFKDAQGALVVYYTPVQKANTTNTVVAVNGTTNTQTNVFGNTPSNN